MRLLTPRRLFAHRPFAGEGCSLYLVAGETDPGQNAIRYRNHRADVFPSLGQVRTDKTNRIASEPAPADSLDLDVSAYVGKTLRLQVRPYLDDVELEVSARSAVVAIDENGDDVTGVKGTLTLLDVELRTGGGVRIKTAYTPSVSGSQPLTLTASRTAGPTSPADVELTYSPGDPYYDFDFEGLSAGTYTFKVFASTASGSFDLLEGITAIPDFTGPPAPTGTVVAA